MGVNRVIQWLFKKGMAVYRLDERFESVDRRFERLETQIDRIETKFDAALEMRERLAVLEALMVRRPA